VIPEPAAAPIDLQRASEGDLEALAELMNAAYGGTGDIAGWTHVKDFLVGDRTSVSALRAEIRAIPQAQLLVVRHPDTGAMRASVWLEPRSATVWYLGSLTVNPREQNSGLGRRILDAAERRMAISPAGKSKRPTTPSFNQRSISGIVTKFTTLNRRSSRAFLRSSRIEMTASISRIALFLSFK